MNMRIKLNKFQYLEDWYTIIRQEHEGLEWTEEVAPNCFQYMTSERISDACVEGTGTEMLAIAHAIKDRKSASFHRCEVFFSGGVVHFSSPRNSQVDGITSVEEADEFADAVIEYFNG